MLFSIAEPSFSVWYIVGYLFYLLHTRDLVLFHQTLQSYEHFLWKNVLKVEQFHGRRLWSMQQNKKNVAPGINVLTIFFHAINDITSSECTYKKQYLKLSMHYKETLQQ